jgi:hypothetical protein
MKISDDDLRAIWREPSVRVPSDRSACLTDEDWARLVSQRMDSAERGRIAEHVGSCSQCADEYRLLQPMQSWMAEAEQAVSPRDDRADRWAAWRAWWSSPRLALAMSAATLLLVTQGVTLSQLVESRRENARYETQLAERERALSSTQNSLATLKQELQSETTAQAQLQEKLARLSTPQLGVAIVDLDPQYSGVVRGTPDPQIVSVSPEASTVTLILNFSPLESRALLEVEVADVNGQVRWTSRTQRDRGTANLTLALPSASYPAGEYAIRLFDVTRDRMAIADYPVVIRNPAVSR